MKKGWSLKKLSEACLINPKKNEIKSLLNDEDLVSFLPMNDLGIQEKKVIPKQTKRLEDVYKGYTYFADNDVLLAKVTPCFENGKLGIVNNLVNGFGFGSSEYIVLRTLGDILPEYIFYFLSTAQFREKGAKLMFGASGLKRLSKDYVDNTLIKYPSLCEQQRIVKILDAAFAKIDTIKQDAERNLQNAKELFKNISNSIFDELSQEERVKKLGEVCDFVRGPFGGSLKKNCFKDEGYPVYEQQHAIYNKFVFRYYIDEDKFQEMKRFEVFPNDILMSCSGTLGKIAIVPKNAPQGIINQALLKLTVKKELLNTFLKAWMESFSFQESLNNYSKGAAIQNVASVKILKDISIHLPSIDKQRQIVTKLDTLSEKCKELENNYRQMITNCDEMKKSILAKAFNGEL